MKNKPLIDNYEQILDSAGYLYCTIGGTFYVYMILPINMTCWGDEQWKYYTVTAPSRKNIKYQMYDWSYQ